MAELHNSLLDVPAAAKRLGISRVTIYRLLEGGKLPHRKIGGRRLFTEGDLDSFLEACAVPAASAPTFREQQAMAAADRRRLRASQGNENE